MFRWALAVATASLLATVHCESANPLVRTAHGILAGSWHISKADRTYASFLGIPYARPPVGKNRFREPQRAKPWIGIWDASKLAAMCLQYDPFVDKIAGSEDCLFANVYTPQPNTSSSLPVVVFIHGGAFMYGSCMNYDPVAFMDRDVVVATFNYRLGPLGFLSTADENVQGNMGLKDQSFALRWVHENIAMFGGDPSRVTLTGQSAGGASVHYHYLSPMSRGLFARGIAFSGSAFVPWALQPRPAEKARELASHIGCPTANVREMVDCLRHRPAESVVGAMSILFDWKVHLFTVFTPTVEPATARGTFLKRPPYEVAISGDAAKLPLITSVTSEEGLYPAAAYQSDPALLVELENRWGQLASEIFIYNETLPIARRAVVADKIKQHYLQGRPVSQETFPQLVQALGDRLFCADVGLAAQIHAAKSGQPVHVYRFSFRGDSSLSNMLAHNTKNYGVSHGDDVLHLLEGGLTFNSTGDVQIRQLLLDMVLSYATTGIPKVDGVTWSPVEPESPEIKYIDIMGPGRVANKTSTDFGQKSFWNSLGFSENEKRQVSINPEL